MPVETPCIGVCMINAEEERCFGCLRTLDEIAHWGSYSDAERRAVMQQLDARRAARDNDLAAGDD